MLDKHIAELVRSAEKYLAKDPQKLANEAADKVQTSSTGITVSGLKPDVYFEKLRANRTSDFKPRHVVPAKEFTKNFDGSYSIELDGKQVTLSKLEMNQRVQVQTSDPNKPTWYVEFYEDI